MLEIGIYLPLIYAICSPWMLLPKRVLIKIAFVTFFIVVFTYLFCSKIRTGLTCITISTLLLFRQHKYFNAKFKGYLKVFLVLISISILTYLFILKNDSTNGRWFIYKTGWKTMLAHFPFGAGYGNYPSVFNHQQAAYFSNHSLTNKAAMLVDDGYYALNEYLHIGIEFGILGLTFMTLITIFVAKKSFQLLKLKKYSTTQFGAILYFASLFIQCLFSYPFHFPIVIVATVFAFNILFSYSFQKRWLYFICHNKFINYSFFTVFTTFGIILSIHQFNASTIYKEALEDIRSGYKKEALQKFQTVSSIYFKKFGFVDIYANTLYLSGRTSEAIILLENAHAFACSHQLHTNLGNWYAEIGDSIRAKQNLEIALYIAPQYLQSRLDLMNFYDSKKNYLKAKYWAEQIMQCPIKIQNSRAYEIKDEAKLYLKHHSPAI